MISLIVAGCSEQNTEYSQTRLPDTFEHITIGDSVEQVYATIGPPLFVDVNPDLKGNGGYQTTSLGRTDLSAVRQVLADTNKGLYLVYSQPKKAGKNYILYQIEIRDGKVFQKSGPSYQD
jgi:hypothetical protein